MFEPFEPFETTDLPELFEGKKRCKVIISDAGPIISLAKTKNLNVLTQTGLTVYIPYAVFLEVTSRYFPAKDDKEIVYIESCIFKNFKLVSTLSGTEMEKMGKRYENLLAIHDYCKEHFWGEESQKQKNKDIIEELKGDIALAKRGVKQKGDDAIFETIIKLKIEEGRENIAPVYVISSDHDVTSKKGTFREEFPDIHFASIEIFLNSMERFGVIPEEKVKEIIDGMKEYNRPDTSHVEEIEASGGSIFVPQTIKKTQFKM